MARPVVVEEALVRTICPMVDLRKQCMVLRAYKAGHVIYRCYRLLLVSSDGYDASGLEWYEECNGWILKNFEDEV